MVAMNIVLFCIDEQHASTVTSCIGGRCLCKLQARTGQHGLLVLDIQSLDVYFCARNLCPAATCTSIRHMYPKAHFQRHSKSKCMLYTQLIMLKDRLVCMVYHFKRRKSRETRRLRHLFWIQQSAGALIRQVEWTQMAIACKRKRRCSSWTLGTAARCRV